MELGESCHKCGHFRGLHATISGCIAESGDCKCQEGHISILEHALGQTRNVSIELAVMGKVVSDIDVMALRMAADELPRTAEVRAAYIRRLCKIFEKLESAISDETKDLIDTIDGVLMEGQK
ncbi:MAG: hypothetical protein GTO24_21360 [candidate division Zixibacteria bacterium]|nr:hypothetical protein [candidate division Zixibacteria bacterium]